MKVKPTSPSLSNTKSLASTLGETAPEAPDLTCNFPNGVVAPIPKSPEEVNVALIVPEVLNNKLSAK